jgi:hypothetical protein
MAPKKDGPYMMEPMGSILETATILGQLLRPEGYSRNVISDMATSIFISNEQQSIRDPASMHLLAIKKTLLYAIPVISAPDGTTGIPLTSQVSTPAIQFHKEKAKQAALSSGDKFRLLGFAFPRQLINHLAYNIFPQKFSQLLPQNYNDYVPSPIDLSFMKQFSVKDTKYGKLFILNKSDYENVTMFNHINRILANKLSDEISAIIKSSKEVKPTKLPTLPRINPFNQLPFVKELNTTLERQIDISYNMAFYEALQMTANWLLYDQIALLGFESNEVKTQMDYLAYVKAQNIKVQANLRDINYKRLLETRAAKIARDKYPYYFDYTDRRAIFVKFNRFSIDKLPKKDQQDVRILLEKDLAAQEALLLNKCEHLQYIKNLNTSPSTDAFKHIESYIDYNSLGNDGMYSCKLCSYPLICVHTVELYDAMSALPEGVDNSDNVYWANQKIINKFKYTNQKLTGDEGTEVSFTYYCKYCGGELGQTSDAIQATIKTAAESTSYNESDPMDVAIFNGVAQAVVLSMNPTVMPLSKKEVVKLIYEEIKDEIVMFVARATKREEANIDTMIKYLTHVYTIVSLISLNINKIKSTQSIINGTGPSLKDELLAGLKLLQSVSTYKRIGISDDKMKSMLIESFKYVNRIFASEVISIKPYSSKDKLALDVQCSPLTHYATFMHNRFTNSESKDALELMGIDLDKLYPKKTKKDAKIIHESHALFKNMYQPTTKLSSDRIKYMIESYQPLVEFAKIEPTNGRYISKITSELSEFVLKYQNGLRKSIQLRRQTPIRYLPVENHREHDFTLQIYDIAYCSGDKVRPHRWLAKKENNRINYVCKYCGMNIEKASKSNNQKIDQLLDEQMMIEAFFELYTVSCPIQDAHVFENNVCTQCGASKDVITSMDLKYYKKYSGTYIKHRDSITEELLADAKDIIAYPKPLDKSKLPALSNEKADLVKLESVASNLNKLFSHKDLKGIGFGESDERQIDLVESYVQLFFSHYTFAKNVSIDTKAHPDTSFFALIKKIVGPKVNSIEMPALPNYPISDNADVLLYKLYNIIFDVVSHGNADVKSVVQYVIDKMVKQDQRHKAFNFAKLKAVAVNDTDEDGPSIAVATEDDDEELDMFDGFDMDEEDVEDNVNGDID